jgi:hypothetical protein
MHWISAWGQWCEPLCSAPLGISDLTAVRNLNVPSQFIRNAATRQPALVSDRDAAFYGGLMRVYELIANRPSRKLMVEVSFRHSSVQLLRLPRY